MHDAIERSILWDMKVRNHGSAVPEPLLRSIVSTLNPRQIILFGSQARGDAGPDSDLDLLVVLDDDVPSAKLSAHVLYEARKPYRGAVDLVPCRVSNFERKARIPGTLPYAAAREGIVVYERS